MIVIGLTGSIGMGKSTAAALLRTLGVPVHDADAAVHGLLARGGAGVAPVAARFPASFDKAAGHIDRGILGGLVFGDDAARRDLEGILHPLVRQAHDDFIRAQQRAGARMVALDIPLLYETGAAARVDKVIVVSAPAAIQAQRVLARPGMSAERFAQILARQMDDAEKRRRADYVVQTGAGIAHTRAALARIVDELNRGKTHDREYGL